MILIDADACPVKDEIYRVARRTGMPVKVVANSYFRVPAEPLSEQVVVGDRISRTETAATGALPEPAAWAMMPAGAA